MKKIFLLVLLFFIEMVAQAQTIDVTNTNDSGPGSLREALSSFSSVWTIRFNLPAGSATINISTPLPVKSSSFIISTVNPLNLTINASGTAVYSSGISYMSFQMFSSPVEVTYNSNVGNLRIQYTGFLATDFVVTTNSANYYGSGSLLWAVESANKRRVNNLKNRVVFNVPQPAPIVFNMNNVYNFGFTRGTIIDGTSQPANGYTGAGPKIILTGPSTDNSYAFDIATPQNGFDPDTYSASGSVEIYGLEITGFDIGIKLANHSGAVIGAPGKGNVISGNQYGIKAYVSTYDYNSFSVIISNNYIGTDRTGMSANPNKYGICTESFNTSPSYYTIKNNVISGNTENGIIGKLNQFSIIGNIIGLSASGDYAIPNKVGIESNYLNTIAHSDPGFTNGVIGGPGAQRNIISGNTDAGIYISIQTTNVKITNNYIGTDITGQLPLANGIGINLRSNTQLIGGNTLSEGNVIAYNGTGINVQGSACVIKNNSIHSNDNGVLRAPLITPVITTKSSTTIAGTATPSATIQLFEDDLQKTSPQGKIFIAEVNTDALGNWSYNGTITNPCQVTAICYQTSGSSGFSITQPDILPDTSKFCTGTTATLDGTAAFNSYLWSDGSTAQQFFTSVEGKYWVRTTLGSCDYSDTTYVMFVPVPAMDLGKDTTLCGSYVLNADAINGATYQWKRNGNNISSATSSSYAVNNQSGAYMVLATVGYCVGSSNTVNIISKAYPTTTNSTIQKCADAPYIITKPTFYTYLWQDGSTANTFTAFTAGRYSVIITNTNGCAANDTTTVLDVALKASFGADTTLCNGQTISYNFTYPGASYRWGYNTNDYASTSPIYTVYNSGQYRVWAIFGNCIKSDTINVTYTNRPVVKLGNDTVVCNTNPLIKSFNTSTGLNYTWSDGSQGNSISINSSGQYWVDARVNAGCFSRDTFNVQMVNCSSISGTIYDDTNQNHAKDASEGVIVSHTVMAINGTLTYYGISDANGRYNLEVPDGNYQIRPSVTGHASITEPIAQFYSVSINSQVASAQQYNFGLYRYSADMSISIYTATTARPGTSFSSTITVTNSGLTNRSGRFQISVDPFLTLVSSSLPATLGMGGFLYVDPGMLSSGQTVTVVVTWSVPLNLSLVGKSLNISASINGAGDQFPNDNVCNAFVLITYPYDPNRISVTAQYFPLSQQQYNTSLLQYLIEFQNTGTDYAEDIVIIDTLPAGVDPSTLVMSSSSHPYTVELYGEGILKFTFENIMLLDSNTNELASHGHISYTINHRSLPLGTVIENEAYIYFDSNAPVQTNTCIYRISGAANKQTISYNGIFTTIYNDRSYIVLNARSTSGLPVTYACQGPVIFSRDTLFLTGATGDVMVGLYQDGDASFNMANPLYVRFPIVTRTQLLSMSAIPDHITTDPPFSLTATGGSSGNPIIYTVVSGPATINNNEVTLTGVPGVVIIEASQAGNQYYSAATSVTQQFNVLQVTATHNSVDATVSVWPNPCVGNLNVSIQEAGTYEVLNTQGKSMMSGACNTEFNLDLSSLPAGVYILKIVSGEKVKTVSVVKQ